VVILFVFIGAYLWLFYLWLLVVIDYYYINGY
jgi:hypothetical protein